VTHKSRQQYEFSSSKDQQVKINVGMSMPSYPGVAMRKLS